MISISQLVCINFYLIPTDGKVWFGSSRRPRESQDFFGRRGRRVNDSLRRKVVLLPTAGSSAAMTA
jgi:hypothetical protein